MASVASLLPLADDLGHARESVVALVRRQIPEGGHELVGVLLGEQARLQDERPNFVRPNQEKPTRHGERDYGLNEAGPEDLASRSANQVVETVANVVGRADSPAQFFEQPRRARDSFLRRIGEGRGRRGLLAYDHAARSERLHHCGERSLWVANVHQDEARVDEVER